MEQPPADLRAPGRAVWPWQHHRHRLEPTPDGLGEPRERVIAGPFDLDYAPKAPGPFLGDYMGMVAVDDWFGLLYVEPTRNRKDPTQVRFVGIRP